MSGKAIRRGVSLACAAALFAACGDQAVPPTAVHNVEPAKPARVGVPATAAAALNEALPEPFTVRAPIDPYFINQAPDLMLRSQVRADLAIQRLVTLPGDGAWHTHPGPSFAIVEKGRVKITRYSPKAGCTATMYGPGEPAGRTYYEVAGEVHRASVLQPETAVEYKVRFNTPIGSTSFATPAADPGC